MIILQRHGCLFLYFHGFIMFVLCNLENKYTFSLYKEPKKRFIHCTVYMTLVIIIDLRLHPVYSQFKKIFNRKFG